MAARKPAVLVIGMAGSGKTTFLQRLQADLALREDDTTPYIINLDPAVLDTPYEPNLDICDTVDYKQVMKQYGLGPNGAILTCLNLFITKWDQVLGLLEEREEEFDVCLVDTPGQIEIFTWSASGAIISETLANSRPTVIAYILDVERCATSPIAFMSNMLYACSIMYKCKLPMCLVLNKSDLVDPGPILSWLTDYYAFQEALAERHSESYMASMMQSMGLVLEEFYRNIKAVSVSSFTGEGMSEVWEALLELARERRQDMKAREDNEDEEGVTDNIDKLSIKDD
jgi:GTPase SAR1 family protein